MTSVPANSNSTPDRWLILFADGTFAGSPLTLRVRNPAVAGCITGATEAAKLASRLGGEPVHVADVLAPDCGVR